MNQTWTDEMAIRDIQHLDWWENCRCETNWDCENDAEHYVSFKLSIGVWHWWRMCDECWLTDTAQASKRF